MQGIWKEQQTGPIFGVWLRDCASSYTAENGQVLSVNGGVQRGECKEAVKKCDATWAGPDPELSGADGKTRNDPWIPLWRDCNHSPQGTQDPPSLAAQRALVFMPGGAEPWWNVVCYCYCYCYYWKKYFHSSEGQLRMMTHLHRRSTQIACAKITIWYNNLHHKTPHFLLPRVSKFQAWGKILASFPKYLCRKNNVAYTEGGREREIMR